MTIASFYYSIGLGYAVLVISLLVEIYTLINMWEVNTQKNDIIKILKAMDDSTIENKGMIVSLQNSSKSMRIQVVSKRDRFAVNNSADVGRPQYIIAIKMRALSESLTEELRDYLEQHNLYFREDNKELVIGQIETSSSKHLFWLNHKHFIAIFDKYFTNEYSRFFKYNPYGLDPQATQKIYS